MEATTQSDLSYQWLAAVKIKRNDLLIVDIHTAKNEILSVTVHVSMYVFNPLLVSVYSVCNNDQLNILFCCLEIKYVTFIL